MLRMRMVSECAERGGACVLSSAGLVVVFQALTARSAIARRLSFSLAVVTQLSLLYLRGTPLGGGHPHAARHYVMQASLVPAPPRPPPPASQPGHRPTPPVAPRPPRTWKRVYYAGFKSSPRVCAWVFGGVFGEVFRCVVLCVCVGMWRFKDVYLRAWAWGSMRMNL